MEVILGDSRYSIPEEWIGRWTLLQNFRDDIGGLEMVLSLTTVKPEQLIKWMDLNIHLDSLSTEHTILHNKMLNMSEILDVVRFFLPAEGRHLLICKIDTSLPITIRDELYKELGRWVRRRPLLRLPPIAAMLDRDPYRILYTQQLREDITNEAVEAMALADVVPLEVLYGVYYNADTGVGGLDWTTVNWSDLKELGEGMYEVWPQTTTALISYCNQHQQDNYLSSSVFKDALTHPVSVLPTSVVQFMLMQEIDSELLFQRHLNNIRSSWLTLALTEEELITRLVKESLPITSVDNGEAVVSCTSDSTLTAQVSHPVQYFDHIYSYLETAVDHWIVLEYMTGMLTIFNLNTITPERLRIRPQVVRFSLYRNVPDSDYLSVLRSILLVMWDRSRGTAKPITDLINMIVAHLGRRCLQALLVAMNKCIESKPRTSDFYCNREVVLEGMKRFCDIALKKTKQNHLPVSLTHWPSWLGLRLLDIGTPIDQ